MTQKYYVVLYSGTFGFIKPWTAVRDSETFSQQFLTPSIVEGIEKKLFPELLPYQGQIFKIKRHRLNYGAMSTQQEKTWSKGGFIYEKKKSIINRGVMIDPHLYLAFDFEEDAKIAYQQHICLCRNEDLLLPLRLLHLTLEEFDSIDGFELDFDKPDFKVGHNRFADGKEMYGSLEIFGNPIRGSH